MAKIFFYMNSFSQGVSGGDLWCIEVAKRINNYDKIVITSLLGKALCESKGLKASFFITTKERYFKRIIFTYIKRIFISLCIKIDISEKDILYSSSDFLPDVIPAFIGKFRNKKVKWIQRIFHLIPVNRVISHNAQKLSHFLVKNFADLIIIDNYLLREELIGQGFQKNKLVVNYLGVDLSYLKSIRASDRNFDAVFLGRIHHSKGIFDLIEIWKYICTKKRNIKLAIIGDGDEQIKKKIEEEIIRAELESNIEIMGYLEHEKAIGIIKSSKIFLFPSHEEGFGIAICEAMACGLPVVAWDLPVYREIFLKGIVKIKKGNIMYFVNAVLKLLEDEELYKKIADEAYKFISRYDYDSTVWQEINMIEQCASFR